MICAKTDLEIARAYIGRLAGGSMDLYDILAAEFRKTVDSLLQIRQSDYLLAGEPLLQTAVSHREPYIDPLSILQIDLLRRKRLTRPGDPHKDALDRAIGATLNGVAQGLRNTG
jgi:phosphoenolpyruvate carboxylase